MADIKVGVRVQHADGKVELFECAIVQGSPTTSNEIRSIQAFNHREQKRIADLGFSYVPSPGDAPRCEVFHLPGTLWEVEKQIRLREGMLDLKYSKGVSELYAQMGYDNTKHKFLQRDPT